MRPRVGIAGEDLELAAMRIINAKKKFKILIFNSNFCLKHIPQKPGLKPRDSFGNFNSKLGLGFGFCFFFPSWICTVMFARQYLDFQRWHKSGIGDFGRGRKLGRKKILKVGV